VSEERRVKCRWCDWSRPMYWTNRNGKARSGFDSLKQHVDDEHVAEALAIEERLDAEAESKRPVTRESWG
jgi:hypothetical protein